jgi:hypothetical protein
VIIAFSGTKFAGKDTVAEALIRSHGFKRLGLADKLKDICSEVFQISRKDMDDSVMKEKPFDVQMQITPIHIRDLLKILLRDGFNFDFDETYSLICKDFMGKNLTSIRDMLQTVGTDMCRNYVKDDIWLQYVKHTIVTHQGNLVITDARFKNEREFLADLGAVMILIIRPGYENKSTHISENQLGSPDEYDVVVTNDRTITAVQSDIAMWYTVMKDAINSKVAG